MGFRLSARRAGKYADRRDPARRTCRSSTTSSQAMAARRSCSCMALPARMAIGMRRWRISPHVIRPWPSISVDTGQALARQPNARSSVMARMWLTSCRRLTCPCRAGRPQHGMPGRHGGRIAGTIPHRRGRSHRRQPVRARHGSDPQGEPLPRRTALRTSSHTWFRDMFTDEERCGDGGVRRRPRPAPAAADRREDADGSRCATISVASPPRWPICASPVMAIQTTYSNERRERRSMSKGQTTPYLDMLRARIPSVAHRGHRGHRPFPADR